MTQDVTTMITAAVVALTDAELDAAAAAARVQYWTATSAEMTQVFEGLVAIIDAERIRRARVGMAAYEAALTA